MSSERGEAGALPLLRRFPALSRLSRARLGQFPTPVERVDLAGVTLWLKRDDLSAAFAGGNKVRALEFLLGDVRPGDELLTVGGVGSTHVLTATAHAARLGARVTAERWQHETHPVADQVARRVEALGARVTTSRLFVTAMLRAYFGRARRRVRWVPLGGTTPLGMLGHVNAGLELAEQVTEGALPAPREVVVPLGTGGTAAGLAVGLALGGLSSTVVGARVGPLIAGNRPNVVRLTIAVKRLIERVTGERLPPLPRGRIVVAHDLYGGAYGRPVAAAERAARELYALTGLRADATYSAKALAVALARARGGAGPVVFWLTFDGRWLEASR